MIRFEKLSATEQNYPFVDAVAAADYANGTFGAIVAGVFTKGTGFKAIMQVEKGDAANTDAFKVLKDEHVRVVDFSKVDGQIVNITKDELPSTYAKGNKLVADSTGLLVVDGEATNNYFEVKEVVDYGVRAVVVSNTETIDTSDFVQTSSLGVANGVATLGADGKLTSTQVPSQV